MLLEHPDRQVQCPQIRELIVFTTGLVIFGCVVGTPSCMTGKIHNGTPGRWRSFPLLTTADYPSSKVWCNQFQTRELPGYALLKGWEFQSATNIVAGHSILVYKRDLQHN